MKTQYKYLVMAISSVLLAGCASMPWMQGDTVDVRVIAINDFHGAVKAPAMKPGGIEYMATAVKALKKENPNNIMVAAGDMIGASPLLSSMFHDEPTIESLGMAGLEVTSVGNHEFDKGPKELLRKQNGGCHPVTGCQGPTQFKGADFQYLAANVIVEKTGKTLLPPYFVKEFEGIPVAFIGLTLEGTPKIVTPMGTKGLRFENEVKTINALVPILQKKGIKAIGVLIHEGGAQKFVPGKYWDINGCNAFAGNIVNIVEHLDKEVDFVISGHTHQAYNCKINGIPVTSAQSNGALVTKLDLKLDKNTKDVVWTKAKNVKVDNRRLQKDPKVSELLSAYEAIATPLANRNIGKLQADLVKAQLPAGDSTVGKVIADAHLYATSSKKAGDAQIAFMNSGGIRAEFKAGDITYNDIYTVQPFSNMMVVSTLTGKQIKALLEQQWDRARPQVMLVSKGFHYTWDSKRPVGDRVLVESMTLNGKPIKLNQQYRIAANEFLALGGSNFTVFKEAKNRIYSVPDVDAVVKYFAEKSPIAFPEDARIEVK